jgi:predicted RNA-binding protein YlxR (DUF448 family)
VAKGEDDEETGPERTCIVTRAKLPTDQLLRFVRAPGGVVTPDLKRKLPGRGVWLIPTRPVLETALKKRAFQKAFRTDVKGLAELPDLVERLFEHSARDAISLANKAGQVVAGFGKVEEALAKSDVIAVLHAVDAASDGVRKVGQLVRRAEEAGKREIKSIVTLPSGDLGLALGRSHVIHAALLEGSAAIACLQKMERLRAFRSNETIANGVDEQVKQPD